MDASESTARRLGRPPRTEQPDIFAALADANRRHLLERLAERPRTVSELTDGLPVSQTAVSQHLRVLRDSGLVEVAREGRFRRYRLRPQGLTELRDWLLALDRFWQERVARLDDYLKESS